jgi:hypothetical protein
VERLVIDKVDESLESKMPASSDGAYGSKENATVDEIEQSQENVIVYEVEENQDDETVDNKTVGTKENDNIQELINDGRFIPLLDRTEENLLSSTIKFLVNFSAAIIQTLNYPILFLGLLVVLETAIKWFGDSQFTFGSKLNWFIYLMGGFLLLEQIIRRTNSNLVSPDIVLIWAVNFKGILNNRFQSLQLTEKWSKDLEELIRTNAKRYSEIREKELITIINSQEQTIKQLLSDFPDDILHSFIRVSGFPTGVASDKKNPRYNFEVLMDRLLGEIASLSVLNGLVHQGSIMLLENQEILRIVGQYNLHDNVVELRKIKLGEKFAGKVVQNGQAVWIPDIYQEDATQYGFGPKTEKKSYKAIIGVPIRRKGYDTYSPIGIINLHFKTSPSFNEEQLTRIQNILEVYTQYIVTLKNLSKESQGAED